MAATVCTSPAVAAGAVPARHVGFVKGSCKCSVLCGRRMNVLCAGVRLCMTAPEAPARFTSGELNADRSSTTLIGSAGAVVRAQASAEGTAETAGAPADPVAASKLESDLLKKKAKREELRRKRLVRKRHLRKKGRWPP